MAELPEVLAGPVVRRVTATSVSVWVALRHAAEVELKVWVGPQQSTGLLTVDSGMPAVASGSASTRGFGTQLHVAVITAKVSVGAFTPGALHSYDLRVGGESLRSLKLLQDEEAEARLPGVDPSAPLHLALGYALDRLPSFATAAPVLTDLCIAHTSCRRTNASGPDAVAYLDDVIRQNFTDISQRPQQLFMTGDQIYADDLGGCLLRQVNEIGRDALGFTEKLPINNADVDVDLEQFPTLRRRRLVREIARFTTTDGTNHLLSYGEFVALHLLSFSPRLWRPLESPEAVFKASPHVAANHLQDWEAEVGGAEKWIVERRQGYLEETKRVEIFRAAVPRVARVLANTATYMIFDDHEVTDDWYLTQSWRSRVLTAPFGRAVIQNAYLAYTLCQGWGNDPDAFSHTGGASKPKNEQLLDVMEAIGAAHAVNAGSRGQLDELLGMAEAVQVPQVHFHYSVPGPVHMVRVLDTRSRRTYKGRLGPPKLLGRSLDAQLPAGPLTDGRELLVVVSAAPVLMPHLFDSLMQPLAAKIADLSANVKQKAQADHNGPPINGNEDRDVEGWGMDEDNLEAMIERLATYPKAIVLSGDVHFSSTLALDYWRGTAPAVASRIVQLTSSAGRNVADTKLRSIIRSARFSQQLLRGLPLERLAWSGKPSVVVPSGKPISPGRRSRLRRSPGLLPAQGWPVGTTIPADKQPESRWRLTVVRDDTPRALLTHPERLQPPLPVFNAASPVDSYNEIASVHAQLALDATELLRTLVFRSNVGMVRIQMFGSEQHVVHQLLTTDGPNSTEGAAYTNHHSPLSVTPALPPPQLKVVTDGR